MTKRLSIFLYMAFLLSTGCITPESEQGEGQMQPALPGTNQPGMDNDSDGTALAGDTPEMAGEQPATEESAADDEDASRLDEIRTVLPEPVWRFTKEEVQYHHAWLYGSVLIAGINDEFRTTRGSPSSVMNTRLYALDWRTGTLLWDTVVGISVYTQPVVRGDWILLSGYDNTSYAICCLDMGSGDLLWESVAGGREAVFTADDTYLYLFNEGDGETTHALFRISLEDGRLTDVMDAMDIEYENYYFAYMAVEGDRVYIVAEDTAVAIDTVSKSVLWRFDDVDEELMRVLAEPVIFENLLLINFYSDIYALDVETGTLAWKWVTGKWKEVSSTDLVMADGILYLDGFSIDGEDEIFHFAVNAATGGQIWKMYIPYAWDTFKYVFNQTLYLVHYGYAPEGRYRECFYLHALDTGTRNPAWEFWDDARGGPLLLAAAAGVVWVNSGGALVGIDEATGKVLLRHDFDLPLIETPIARDGLLILLFEDGAVAYAIKEILAGLQP